MMTNRIFYFCATFIVVFFAFGRLAHAGFEISEIMYDLDGTDTNREWVEVENTGTESADLSKWFFFSDNSKHVLVSQGESMVPPGGFAVVAQNVGRFRSDWPNFLGLLFDSSWTGFNNEGETIALKDPDLNLLSNVAFTATQGASGDGNSLQKVTNTWFAAVPTPGATNQSGSFDEGVDKTSNPTSPSPVKKKEIEVPKITTNIITKSTVFSGIPFEVDATTFGYSKEPIKMGRFVWNFGDGTMKTEYEHAKFEHEYHYPGEYVIMLSYYRAWTGPVLEATDRVAITVIPPLLSISSVGKASDPYVEISNKSTLEVDLSRWIIQGSIHPFVIPEGTIILPNQKLRFGSRATNFSIYDMQSIILLNTNKESLATYPVGYKGASSSPKSGSTADVVSNSSSPSVINLNDLGASANDAKSIKSLPGNIFAWMGSIGIIIIGLVSIILIHRKGSKEAPNKELEVEDMKIIE